MKRRTQAERDAMTIEIGYALASAVFLAALTFAGLFVPALFFFDLGPAVRRAVLWIAAAAAVLAFGTRVVHVLRRFPRREGAALPGPARSSRPGRTSPDS